MRRPVMRFLFLIETAALLLSTGGCGDGEGDHLPDVSSTGEMLRISVSVLPQVEITQQLAGELAEVSVVIPPGASPAIWSPSPSERELLERTDILLAIGVPWEESWVPRFSSSAPDLEIRDVSEGVTLLPIDRHSIPEAAEDDHSMHDSGNDDRGHDHAEEHRAVPRHEDDDLGHDREGDDPHIWLSPELMRSVAENTTAALVEIDPENTAVYQDSLVSLLAEVDALQDTMQTILAPYSGRSFMVFHPAWGYFADEFGLRMIPVEIAGSEPSPAEMAALVDAVEYFDITVIFISPQFSSASAETIAETSGIETAVLDPLAPDWTEGMLRAASAISEALADD